MHHQDIRDKLSEYIDDAVTAGERSVIEAHLAACTECSDALRELRKTIEHIRTVEEIEPPAWLAQKVMAKVGEESLRRSRRWSFFDRFVMLRPVRVLAVLALTVTAYYIYLNLEPAGRQIERPVEVASRDEGGRKAPASEAERSSAETPAARTKGSAPAMGRSASAPKKDLPQSPEYRSLDMKYSYEQPPPPEPAAPPASDAAPPALAKKEAVPSKTDVKGPIAAAPQTAAPLAERSRALPDQVEAKSPAALQDTLRLTLETATAASTAEQAAKTFTDLGGKIVKFDIIPSGNIIFADIPTDAREELIKRLRKLGTLRDLPAITVARQQRTLVELTVLTPSARQSPQNE